MDSNTDTPIVGVTPLGTTFLGNSETARSTTVAEQILIVPVAPTESTALELAPTNADVVDRKEDIIQGEAVVPAKVHVNIADDLMNGKSEQRIDSLKGGVAAVDPVLTEIHVETSAIDPSAISNSEMNVSNEAEPGNDLAPIHSNVVATLHDSLRSPFDIHRAEGDQKEDSRSFPAEGVQGTESTLPLPETASGHRSQNPSAPGAEEKPFTEEGTAGGPTVPIPSMPEQISVLPQDDQALRQGSSSTGRTDESDAQALRQASSSTGQTDESDAQALRQASSSTAQTDETLYAYGGPDPLMVQEAALLDIKQDPRKISNKAEAKSPLIDEIDYCEIMENPHYEGSEPIERQNINGDRMVQEAKLLDVQDNPSDCGLQQKSFPNLGSDSTLPNNNVASEVRKQEISDQRTDSFTTDTLLKSTGEGDDVMIMSVDDEPSNAGVKYGETTQETFPADSRKRPRVDLEAFSKPSGQSFQTPVMNPGGLSIGSTRLPLALRQRPHSVSLNTPEYMDFHNFTPTWSHLLPTSQKPAKNERRLFRLSLLNVNEFTITGVPIQFGRNPTPISGLRASIKAISRDHGKAVYERDPDGSGKWRIPLGAYHGSSLCESACCFTSSANTPLAFASFLQSDPLTSVEGIPQHQLQVASMERARQAQGYPSAQQLEEKGVPSRLAIALAPFQRGGVDFVSGKNGRALIADGK